ncbi:MAG: hypothetical protein MMC33_004888 [Icmadophila ericetorum]|nr:hypothetical protein [Icmadophila ericetorum]
MPHSDSNTSTSSTNDSPQPELYAPTRLHEKADVKNCLLNLIQALEEIYEAKIEVDYRFKELEKAKSILDSALESPHEVIETGPDI